MRKFLAGYLCIALIVLTTPAYAQEACKKPQALTSPCSGVLLPTDAAEEGLRCLKIDVPKLKLELEYKNGLFESQKNYYELVLKAEQDRSRDLSKQIDTLLKKPLPKKSVLDSPVLWTVVGVLVGAGATIGIAYALPRN